MPYQIYTVPITRHCTQTARVAVVAGSAAAAVNIAIDTAFGTPSLYEWKTDDPQYWEDYRFAGEPEYVTEVQS